MAEKYGKEVVKKEAFKEANIEDVGITDVDDVEEDKDKGIV